MAPVRSSSFETITADVHRRSPIALKHLKALLLDTARQYPTQGHHFHQNGIDSKHVFVSYPELIHRASHLAGQLFSAGLERGKIALLYLSNHEQYTDLFWACQFAGVIPCVLTPLTQDRNQRVAHLTHLSHLLAPKVITTPELVEDLSVAPELDVLQLPALAAMIPSPIPELSVSPDDIACLMLTSGSTGNAKAVELTHRNVLSAVSGKSNYHGTSSRSVFLNWINFDHVACLTEIHLHAMLVGGNQYHVPAADLLTAPLDYLRLIERAGVTYTFAPQFLLAALERELSAKQFTFHLPRSLCIISGGEACSTKICQKLMNDYLVKFGAPANAISPGFGMTETCAGSIYGLDFPRCDVTKVRENGSVGWCIPCQEMRIVDSDTKEPVENNVQGDLQVRGANVFRRYHNNPKATEESFTKDGWFSTGDRAYICEDGLVMAGRDKDSLILNGVKYFSSELEGMLEDAGIPGLASSWVATFPVRFDGDSTEDFVILYKPTYHPRQDPALHHETVRAIADNCVRYSSHKARAIVALPEHIFGAKSTLGKLSRPKLRKRYEAGEFARYEKFQIELLADYRRSKRVSPKGKYEVVVVETIAQVFDIPAEDVGRNDNFFELGGSSMELLRFKGLLSQRLGTKRDVPLTTIFSAPIVHEIASAFEEAETTEHVYQPIVPLQIPKKTNTKPLFFFHPGVGEVLVFIQLSNYIKDRPVYALRASGFQAEEELFTSVPQMVECYYHAIKEKQPHGPYFFAGYSYGGILAFEMAKKMEADGDEVRFLATLDRSPHIKARMKSLRWVDDIVSIAHLLQFITLEQATELKVSLSGKPQDQVLQHLISIAPPEKLATFEMDVEKFERWTSIGYGLHQLARSYEPTGSVNAKMHAFYADPLPGVAANREEWAKEIEKWKDFSSTEPALYSCPGGHYTMIDGDHVQAFQAIFLKALALSN